MPVLENNNRNNNIHNRKNQHNLLNNRNRMKGTKKIT